MRILYIGLWSFWRPPFQPAPRVTHLWSVKVTHTKNSVFAACSKGGYRFELNVAPDRSHSTPCRGYVQHNALEELTLLQCVAR